MTASSTTLTALQTHVAREIVAYIRRDNLRSGEHLTETLLAEKIGTSRSPVNVALRFLAKEGVLTHDLNRGYFLSADTCTLDAVANKFSAEPDDPLYLQIAEDRLQHRLDDEVNEVDLMRLYDTSRNTLRKVLLRIQQEGWMEKMVGHGWVFLPLIDSPEAYEESYVFRTAIEPTGLLASTFSLEKHELVALRRQQQFIVDGGYRTMTSIELFESNSQFHETLAKWSGNRFILQSVKRTNQLRRLIEYGQAREREPRREQAAEHVAILDAILAQDMLTAATLLRGHLDGARRGKIYSDEIFPPR